MSISTFNDSREFVFTDGRAVRQTTDSCDAGGEPELKGGDVQEMYIEKLERSVHFFRAHDVFIFFP